MTDLLDFAVDGVMVRETDLSQFRTEPSLREWRKRVMAAWQSRNGGDAFAKFDVVKQLDGVTGATVDKLRASIEERKSSMPWRHQSLVVITKNDDRVASMTYDIGGLTAQNIYFRHFDMFVRAEQMTAYEYDAYAMLGEAECDRLEIETLHDMFGTEWAERFYRRKNVLIKRVRLNELYAERCELCKEIEAAEKELLALGG